MSIMTEEQKRTIDLGCSYTAGKKEGIALGEARGEARGRAEGKAEGQLKTISYFEQLGVDPQIIEQAKKNLV